MPYLALVFWSQPLSGVNQRFMAAWDNGVKLWAQFGARSGPFDAFDRNVRDGGAELERVDGIEPT
ncbi:hypothetical protein I5192_10705 [Ruegeria sp. SCSIO 43209]|uniref:hypothetical protein n=1 Tax=Ruegeria sp. SCSIO 43209 TaxID=2793010 RepID=UPI00147FE87B|nr:hypothetical protein [Ruegeria sp. SCSIO 43209]UAB87710.1 hypothetical protein I5192_10705 [Ruegeria sp. SCSIO 43209]